MSKYRIPTNHESPPDNSVLFEEYFGLTYDDSKRKENDRIYLPVYWTNYYVSKNYGKDDMSDLQEELDALPRDKQYFTICQWDDGVLHDLKDLDIYVYGQGGYGDYPIPLNCIPHGNHSTTRFDLTPTLASFIGSIEGRHPVREKMKEVFDKEPDCIVEDRRGKGTFSRFTKMMSESKFALCPRGYGKTSFRICEALEAGVIPVYIYDDPWIPYVNLLPFEGYGILCHEDDIESLPDYLRKVSKDADLMRDLKNNGKIAYEKFYSYSGCIRQILRMESLHNAKTR
jgi:hypothetical protein